MTPNLKFIEPSCFSNQRMSFWMFGFKTCTISENLEEVFLRNISHLKRKRKSLNWIVEPAHVMLFLDKRINSVGRFNGGTSGEIQGCVKNSLQDRNILLRIICTFKIQIQIQKYRFFDWGSNGEIQCSTLAFTSLGSLSFLAGWPRLVNT